MTHKNQKKIWHETSNLSLGTSTHAENNKMVKSQVTSAKSYTCLACSSCFIFENNRWRI